MTQLHGFRDRRDAGVTLAQELARFAGPDLRVFALPRGGVPVGLEVARHLRVPLDVFIVRKLGIPEHPELAMGAIASGDVQVLNEDVVSSWQIGRAEIAAVTARESAELHRREVLYRRGRLPAAITDHEVVLVDDGLATGASMRAALVAMRRLRAARVIVAVPVGPQQTCERLRAEADVFVCPLCPDHFLAVGEWYEDFPATSDAEVRACLDAAAALRGTRGSERSDLLAE